MIQTNKDDYLLMFINKGTSGGIFDCPKRPLVGLFEVQNIKVKILLVIERSRGIVVDSF
jgi:hypothetical protein